MGELWEHYEDYVEIGGVGEWNALRSIEHALVIFESSHKGRPFESDFAAKAK